MIKVDPSFLLVDEIDERKTVENGKRVCQDYSPLLERRRRQVLATPMNTGSLIKVSNDSSGRKRSPQERIELERCMWGEDQVSRFIKAIKDIMNKETKAGLYLYYKYVCDMTDEEIMKITGWAVRTLRLQTQKGHYLIAIWCNQEEFMTTETFDFEYNSSKS